ncbi:MAG: hypothetical protein M5U26_13155 [Planctomycetota bacterium]|nr:hypothetical protein [Planctomycetota bacterium]
MPKTAYLPVTTKTYDDSQPLQKATKNDRKSLSFEAVDEVIGDSPISIEKLREMVAHCPELSEPLKAAVFEILRAAKQ